MRRTSSYVLVLVALVGAVPLGGQEAGEAPRPSAPRPLFESDAPLELTLEADFSQLRADRDEESEERPAVIRWMERDGSPRRAELQVRTRGSFRLQERICPMPPLRLDFKTGAVRGTVFEGQDKVKLVTFCRDRDDYEENVVEEYLAYRIYNEITDQSFQVRLARITYVDASGRHDPITRYGFIIESEEALAERLGATILDAPQVPPSWVDGPNLLRLSVFEHLVGNTDWSVVELHNVRLFLIPPERYVVVPYDFDMAGLVNAPYAAPDPSLRIIDVRQRLYRGYCRADADYRATYTEFIERKEDVLGLIARQPGLGGEARSRAARYVERFYEVIEDADAARRRIENACREVVESQPPP